MKLPAAAQARFQKLVGMFGSAHEGERANAFSLASTILTKHGLRWEEVLGGTVEKAPSAPSGTSKRAFNDGYKQGYQRGVADSKATNESQRAEQRRVDHNTGYQRGFADGKEQGLTEGYQSGLNFAQKTAHTGVQDSLHGSDFHETVSRCLQHARLLSEWEVGFLANIATFDSLSDKQTAVLDRIVRKLSGIA